MCAQGRLCSMAHHRSTSPAGALLFTHLPQLLHFCHHQHMYMLLSACSACSSFARLGVRPKSTGHVISWQRETTWLRQIIIVHVLLLLLLILLLLLLLFRACFAGDVVLILRSASCFSLLRSYIIHVLLPCSFAFKNRHSRIVSSAHSVRRFL